MRSTIGTAVGLSVVLVILSMTSCVFKSGGTAPPPSGNFTFHRPACNQSVKMGGTDSITWTNLRIPLPQYVSIALFKGSERVSTIATSTSNVGMYRWAVPRIGSGSDYRIRLQSASDTTISAFSCNFNLFSEYTGSLKMTSPAPSSACTTNRTFQIQWQSTGNPGSRVSLKLCDDTNFVATIASSCSTSLGVYSWVIPASIAGKSTYRVKIASLNDPSIASFSAQFSIVGMGADLFEPDNIQDSASPLTIGSAQSHSLTPGDTDWVSFKLDSGTTYLVKSSGGIATRIYFFYDTVTSLNTVLCNSLKNASYPWLCQQSGTWYARISAYDPFNAAPDTYSFSVSVYDSQTIFVSPGKNSTWAAGSSYPIQWIPDTTLLGSYINLYLYKGSQQVQYVYSSNLSNSGTYTWYVPAGLASGNDYRIKIVNYSNTSQAWFSPVFIISGILPDSYEPDNAKELAGTFSPFGKSQSRNLTLNDTDWVKLPADSGTVYLLQSAGDIPTRVYLYYGNESSYSTSFYTSSSSTPAYLQWSCPKSGGWYARITSYSSGSTGNYTFNAAVYDSLAAVSFIAPTEGIVWASGSSYQIQWVRDSTVLGPYVYLYLYKGSQQLQYIYSSSLANSGVYTWYVPTGLVTGGDYRIKIANYNNAMMGGFSPNFTITGISPDAFEPDGNRASASTLSPLGKAQAHNITTNDTDWVKFTADSGSVYLLQSVGGTIATRVYLYYGSETSYTTYFYTSSTSTPAYLQWICPRKGDWYARITAYSGSSSTGAYSFNVSYYDSLKMATFVSPAQGATWSAGSSYQIQWTPDSAVLGTYVTLYLYKGSQQLQYIYSSSLANSGVYTWTIPTGLASGGDYRIRIANYSNTTMGGFSPSFSISGISADAYEPDDLRGSAATLSPLGKAQAHNLTVNDTDWVKFTLDSGKTYLLQSIGTMGTRVYLFYGSDASYTTYFYSSSGSTPAYLTWRCTRNGVWYARIGPYSSGYTGTYSFNVSPYDSLAMVSFASPTAVSAWSTGSTYQIQWTPDTALLGTYVYLYLYKGNRYLQYISSSSTSNSGLYSWSVPTGLATGADYRIKVLNGSNSTLGGFSPAFTVSGVAADAFEPDDSLSMASAITADGTGQNRVLTLLDIDWMSFTAQKDSIYVVSALTGAGSSLSSMYVYIYNSSNSSLAYQSGSNPRIVWTCPSSGTYYLKAYPASTSYYGSYAIALKKYSSATTVSFISPTAQSAWAAGSPSTIQWVADSILFGPSVRLQLAVDTTVVQTIISSTANTGSYSWTVTSGLPSGKKYAIKLSSYNTTSLFGFSPAFTITGVEPDAYEPDDSVVSAHTVSTAGTAENHTLPLLDKDWFAFDATANYLYVVKITGATRTVSTQLYLYGTDGKTAISSTSSTTADSSATLSMFCSVAGKYFFRVTPYSSSGSGAYQASVTAYDSTKYGYAVSAPAAGDSVVVGQSKAITWSSQIPLQGTVDIFLFNGAGVAQTVAVSVTNTGTYTWTIPAAVAAGSDYYIKVISRVSSNISGASGVFRIKAN